MPTSTLDEIHGVYNGSNGGTERMFFGLKERLSKELWDKNQIICSRVRTLLPNKKHILWLHDTWNDPESKKIPELLKTNAIDKYVFVSNYQFQTYHMAYGIPYSKSVVIPNAIQPFHDLKKLKTNIINLIYHTTPHRGLEILLPVFDRLVQEDHSLHLDLFSSFEIYGWKERDSQYKELIDYYVNKNKVYITNHGYKQNDFVRAKLRNSHIFAFPSIWPETSCISAIEAMAAGCAIVSPDYAALSETIIDKEYQYRFHENPAEHSKIFEKTLKRAISDIRFQKKNFTFQSFRANMRYDWLTVTRLWETLLKEVENG